MKINNHSLLIVLIVTVLVTDLPFFSGTALQVAGVAEAQDPPRRRRRGRRPGPPPAPAPKPEKKEAEPADAKEAEYLAIIGATVHTVTGPVIQNGTILCKDGKILSIGADIVVPESTQKIEAMGFHVYPGLVAFRSSGLIGSGDPEKSQDPFALNTVMGLAAGITSTWNGSRVGKLVRGELEGLTIRAKRFPSISYTSRNSTGKRELRQALERIQEHLRALERHAEEKKENPDAKAPDDKWIRGVFAVAKGLLMDDDVALARVSTRTDLKQICDLSRRFGFRLVVECAEEAWIDPGMLARTGASVVLTPRARRDADESRNAQSGSSIENAKILYEHGIPVAIRPGGLGIALWGLAGRDLGHLPMEAAFAVRGGLSETAAIEAITIEPARILGVADRIGSIEVGKDADFIITDGELLSYLTHVRWAVINGKVQYDKMKEGLLDHIRPGGDEEPKPPADHWPRRLGDPL